LSADWRVVSRAAKLRVEGDAIRVACGAERFQQVNVDDSDPEAIRLWSRVAVRSRQPDAEYAETPPEVEAWLINRYRELVGFKVVERGTIIGEAWLPAVGLTSEEWALYVRTVAKACDRLEYLWTGVDRE
jgi:hypothetical protein